jgi:hypothetical protein
MKTRSFLYIILVFALAFITAGPALAQAEDQGLRLRISKVLGYGSFSNSEFQGTIKVWVDEPEDLQKVIFYIDGEVMKEVNQAPFQVTFNTGNYSLGEHTLIAVGSTTGGEELRSNEIRTSFVTPSEGLSAGLRIVVPLLVIVLLASLIGTIGPVLLGRGKTVQLPYGAERKYGFAGGAICTRCQRPFPLRALALNLGPSSRFDRCPYCGKWAVVRRRSMNDLRTAEAAELELAQQSGLAPVETEEEKLRKELERSRYQNL